MMKKHLLAVCVASTLSGVGGISSALLGDVSSRNGIQMNGRRNGGTRIRSGVPSPADRIRSKAQQLRRVKA